VGNLLLRDEGVGIHAVRALEERGAPDGIEVLDGGTAGLDALAALGRVDKLVVIDAVEARGPAGSIYRFTPDDVAEDRAGPVMSLHDIGLLDNLAMARQIGLEPGATIVFGVVPEAVDWGLELSPAVAARVPELLELVIAETEEGRGAGIPGNGKGGQDAHLRAQTTG
jgi:hydrogenase maturation protease